MTDMRGGSGIHRGFGLCRGHDAFVDTRAGRQIIVYVAEGWRRIGADGRLLVVIARAHDAVGEGSAPLDGRGEQLLAPESSADVVLRSRIADVHVRRLVVVGAAAEIGRAHV